MRKDTLIKDLTLALELDPPKDNICTVHWTHLGLEIFPDLLMNVEGRRDISGIQENKIFINLTIIFFLITQYSSDINNDNRLGKSVYFPKYNDKKQINKKL